MLRTIFVAVLAVPFAASLAASKPELPAVSHAARACTASGAFGREFAAGSWGHVDATADDEWAPFEKLTIAGSTITVEASFHGAGDTAEDDTAQARKFLKTFARAVEASHKFAEHEAHSDGVEFRTRKQPDTGLIFQLRLDRDHVIAACRNAGY